MDPERLLLELAINRGVLTPQQARDAYAAHHARPSAGGLPETLVRLGVDAIKVSSLRTEIAAQLRARGGQDGVVTSRATPMRPQSGVQQSLYAPPAPPSSSNTPFRPDDQTFVARSVTEAMFPTARLPTRRDPPSSSGSGPLPDSQQSIRPKVGSRFGRYELLNELGRGGMGVVFRARQGDLERVVALKMLLLGEAAGPADRERFFSEARHAAKLAHRAIVAVHDVGEVDGIHYFTMDFVEGEDLCQRIKAKGRLEPKDAVELALQIAEGLGYAHEQGVVHRDLKPSNVLIDKTGRARITDFGIAKDLARTSTTRAGEVLGTPNYMPPEQADGRALEVDARADIYSLGAVIYEMLTGRPPFEGKTGYAILQAVINERPKAPTEIVGSVPRDLETIVLKCLEKDRANRYPTAQAVAAELARWNKGESIEAEPTRGPILPGRAKFFVAGAAVLAGLLGGGLVYVRDLSRKAAAAQQQADQAAREKEAEAERAREAEAERAAAEKATGLVKEALEAVAHDERDHAIALALEAVERAPRLALAHSTLARLYLELRSDGERAIAESDAAIARDATSLEAHATRARALALQRQWSDALLECDAVANLGNEGKAAAARIRGDIFNAKGETDLAIKELERAIFLAPRDAETRVALAQVYLQAQRWAEAERVATAAHEIDARSVAALVARADARVHLERPDDALEDASEAARLNPRDPQARALVEKLGASSNESSQAHKALHERAQAALAAVRSGDRAKAEAWLAARRQPGECAGVLSIRAAVLKWDPLESTCRHASLSIL